MIVIQTFQDVSADFSQTISLDDIPFTLRMTWNTRIESWFMDILDKDKNNILLGIRLVPNYLLIKDYSQTELPPGDFYLWDSENTPSDFNVTFDTLGRRYILLYVTKGEMVSL